MRVDRQQVIDLSQQLWSEKLGLTIVTDSTGDGPGSEERTWSSCVKVSGGWAGAIVVECPESIVRHAAAMLFQADGETPSDEEIRDASRELAALTGRRMRGLLPDESKLSRASLVIDDLDDSFEGMQDLGNFELSCEGRPVRIAIYEATPELV